MRRTVAKRLYRRAIRTDKRGSRMTRRKDGSKFWVGAKRLYRDFKKAHMAGGVR